LDSNYSNSYTAQIFQKWKAEYRLQSALRQVDELQAHVQQVQDELKAVTSEKESLVQQAASDQQEVEHRLEEAQKSFDSSLSVARDNFAAEKQSLLADLESKHRQMRLEWEDSHQTALARAKEDWSDSAANQARLEREEHREREKRIHEEREKIRQEVEEARRLELEAIKSREVSTSMSVANTRAAQPKS
jgi:hypothetical protein